MTAPRPAPRGSAAGDPHPSLRERVYAELRERIIEAEYPAGTRLVEREIADELRVSRVPVREAMQRLESEGFLSVQPRRGAVVTEFGPEDAEHLFDVRENLEGLAARLAARHARPEDLAAMEELLARARRAAESGRLREAVSLNADFHRRIVELSGNPLLVDLMTPLDSRLRRLFRLTSADADGEPMCGAHERLYEAVRDRDESAAESLARAHVAATRASALRLLNDRREQAG
ncbi:Putative GntR family transcriptional regulator [Streptomyces venezuelae]|uniref:GntR family transcriptional regulator n=1 Tax=Streptomyces gardneri TaxID=66892 RepID=UPI0006BC339A|nr:GntR family transcriptional regulator [Streptomyces gardneri]ALO07516.1 Putative GntR family transcriptional regulator [Streptomyces venezuelae]QPK44831.1 GntR family transcriptional regulator [Streptomyces gardneri]WRK36144.1 GntR family transcriptional regulator [Streptomyces venezuelae]CUM42160.1 Transcriptional regulator, GntR family [Streptomyces venezuelae]